MSLKNEIISLAASHGADLVGVAHVSVYTDYIEQVHTRLQETGATGKDYMLGEDAMTFFENLSDVRRKLASAKSIVLLGVYSFDAEGDYKATRQKLQGKTARTYAYYPVVRQIAEHVSVFIEEAGQHIPLKHAANDIGLGSYGWNGLLLTRDFGSYVALRAVVTDAELEPDIFEPPLTPCENCGRYAPYKVNPSLCINPLTRKEDDIPQPLRKEMSNWVCGCDICQEVCPVNRSLKSRVPDPRAGFDPSHHASHQTLGGLTRCPDLKELMEDDGMPVMKRNAIIALANIGTAEARENSVSTLHGLFDRVAKRTAKPDKPDSSDGK